MEQGRTGDRGTERKGSGRILHMTIWDDERHGQAFLRPLLDNFLRQLSQRKPEETFLGNRQKGDY